MIVVTFNKPDFEYDVHSLLKAFFANENVQMYYSCNPQELSEENVACTAHAFDEEAKAQISEAEHVFEIKYEEKKIEILEFDEFLILIDLTKEQLENMPNIDVEYLKDEKYGVKQ